MAFQDVTKEDVFDGFIQELEQLKSNYPGGYLTQAQAESLQQELAQKGYEEAGKVIDPTKVYPPLKY